MKKLLAILLALIMVLSVCTFAVNAEGDPTPDYKSVEYIKTDMLYVHGTSQTAETEAWQHWQKLDLYRDYDEDEQRDMGVKREDGISKEYYFFLPSGADGKKAEILNTFSEDIKIGDVTVGSWSTAVIDYNTTDDFKVTIGGEEYTFRFRKSGAEAAVYINNPDADGNGTDLFSYLSQDKENDAKATGAIVNKDGSVDNTPVKKIKGRGNTTWQKEKKPFNVTYEEAVSIDGMEKTKKLSLLANYQDSTLARNRILFGIADAVGIPYSSDSRFVDFYMNGEYLGTYEIAQKVDIGKKNLVKVIDDDTHLNEDGTLKEEFPFLVEIDAGAGNTDYHTYSSKAKCNLTVKGPELDNDDPYYDKVLHDVKTKFDEMYTAVVNDTDNLTDLVDIDSLAKLVLINELSKNWDVGISSFYLTYQADEDGNYKFFGSPCWDYDNSIGNATGVKSDLRNMGVTDYEEPTGWWTKLKLNSGRGSGKGGKYTLPGYAAMNETIYQRMAEIWFEDFVPALETLNSENVAEGVIYSKDVYYNYLKDSAEMNYEIGWRINTGDWICDHSELTLGTYDKETGAFTADTEVTKYTDSEVFTYEGEYNYMIDWLNTRAAWLSSEFYKEVYKELILGDANLDGSVNVKDATLIQKAVAKLTTLEGDSFTAADVNADSKLSVQDATNIQKFAANYETPYKIGEAI
ncbi:MAG: CotH kinase family protein [Clostridia bacterium]|nr:CotH kinase family protein [Clostridia bacterium]